MHPDLELEVRELHKAHASELLRFAVTFCPDEQAGHDAVQEAFVRYFIERRYGREIANPRAWLYQVVRNYMLDRMKSAAVRQEVPMEEAESLPALQRDPEVLAQRSETVRELTAALSRRELQCLRLRSEGLSYEEISQAMVISSGTVAALLAHVHSKLRGFGRERRGWTFAGTREALRYLVMEVVPEAP